MTVGDAVMAVWVALGGGVGAALRYGVGLAVAARWHGRFPLGTVLVNVSGSFALGLVMGLLAGPTGSGGTVAVLLGTGALGGYTTFSTASYDTVRLARDGRFLTAAAYGVGTMTATVAAAALGWWLAGS
jgi:CrcB protein